MKALQSRRHFLGVFASAIPLLGVGKIEPEFILFNGNIFTANPAEPAAQAVAVAGGRLLAVGSNADVLNMGTPRTKKVDLGNKTVLPGFIDTHTHPYDSGIKHLKMVDCDLRSINDIKEAIRQRTLNTPKGHWVLGFKYDDTKTKEGRKITLTDLDDAAPRTDVKGNTWGANQSVTVEEAIKIGTIHGAYASFEEDIKGSLEAGKLADFVVLGRNPFKENPSTLVSIPIERTMAGGKWVYES